MLRLAYRGRFRLVLNLLVSWKIKHTWLGTYAARCTYDKTDETLHFAEFPSNVRTYTPSNQRRRVTHTQGYRVYIWSQLEATPTPSPNKLAGAWPLCLPECNPTTASPLKRAYVQRCGVKPSAWQNHSKLVVGSPKRCASSSPLWFCSSWQRYGRALQLCGKQTIWAAGGSEVPYASVAIGAHTASVRAAVWLDTQQKAAAQACVRCTRAGNATRTKLYHASTRLHSVGSLHTVEVRAALSQRVNSWSGRATARDLLPRLSSTGLGQSAPSVCYCLDRFVPVNIAHRALREAEGRALTLPLSHGAPSLTS